MVKRAKVSNQKTLYKFYVSGIPSPSEKSPCIYWRSLTQVARSTPFIQLLQGNLAFPSNQQTLNEVQKIDGTMLNDFGIVVAVFSVMDKAN